MYKNFRILAVVPARGGSKGIPDKNIYPVRGMPLVGRVASLLSTLTYVDTAVISTDNENIAAVAKKYGLTAPFRRPAEISGDRVGDFEVLHHGLTESERIYDCSYDIVIMLQPTSPMRTASDVTGALDLLIAGQYDAVWSVGQSDTKNHPLKQLIVSDGVLDYYDQAGKNIISRQQLKPLFQRNGVVYAIKRHCLTAHGNIKGHATGAYIIEKQTVSIDNLEDVDYVEFLMEKYGDPLDQNWSPDQD